MLQIINTDKKTQFNQLLDELQKILEDFDNLPYRDDPEARIKGEGAKVEKYSDGRTTPYEKLMTELDNFYRNHENEIFHKKQN